MSCGKNFDSGSCVIDILKDIVDAQNDVMHDCTTSCEQSIADLLGDTGNGGSNFDTVPVILYCKDCKPFKGFGSRRGGDNCEVRGSFFFRVKSVDDDGCAILELLFSDDRRGRGDDEEGGRGRGSGHHHRNNPTDPADQDCDDLRASGICITVDLNCFCHVTCLPAAQTL